MWTPDIWRSVRLFLRMGNYLIARLMTAAELAFIRDEFQAAHTALAEADAQHESAVDAGDRVAALRDQKREALAQEMRTAGHMIRRAAGNNTRSQIYLKYFPDGTRRVIGRPIPVEIAHAKSMITKLQTETDPLLQSQIPVLATALEEMESSVRQHDDALAEEQRTRALLQVAKQAWINAYRTAHSRLRIHFCTNPGRAESFFRHVARKNTANDEPASTARTQPANVDILNQGSSVVTSTVPLEESTEKAA